MRPLLLRPAWFFNGCNNDFSGVDVVISAKSEPVMLRRPFEVGLYFLIATFFPPNLMSYLLVLIQQLRIIGFLLNLQSM